MPAPIHTGADVLLGVRLTFTEYPTFVDRKRFNPITGEPVLQKSPAQGLVAHYGTHSFTLPEAEELLTEAEDWDNREDPGGEEWFVAQHRRRVRQWLDSLAGVDRDKAGCSGVCDSKNVVLTYEFVDDYVWTATVLGLKLVSALAFHDSQDDDKEIQEIPPVTDWAFAAAHLLQAALQDVFPDSKIEPKPYLLVHSSYDSELNSPEE